MTATQTLTIDTIVGKKKLKAPKGWKFDKTATTVWLWLINYTFEKHTQKHKLKRDELILDHQIHALAIVLANALGMAPFFWEQAARELMNER